MYLITKTQLINLAIHVGHTSKKWVKSYSLYIYAIRNKMIIFNLDYVVFLLQKAIKFLQRVLFYKGNLFSVSSFVNVGFQGLSEYFFSRLGFPYYDGIFKGGIVSNFFKLNTQIMKKKRVNSEFEFRLDKKLIGKQLPSTFLIFDTNEFFGCIREASYVGVPSVALVDSDLDHRDAFYPIVGNNENIFFNVYLLMYITYMDMEVRESRFKKYLRVLISILMLHVRYKIYSGLLRLQQTERYLGILEKTRRRRRSYNRLHLFKREAYYYSGAYYDHDAKVILLLAQYKQYAMLFRIFFRTLTYEKYRYRLFWFLYFLDGKFAHRRVTNHIKLPSEEIHDYVGVYNVKFKFIRSVLRPERRLIYDNYVRILALALVKKFTRKQLKKMFGSVRAYRMTADYDIIRRNYFNYMFSPISILPPTLTRVDLSYSPLLGNMRIHYKHVMDKRFDFMIYHFLRVRKGKELRRRFRNKLVMLRGGVYKYLIEETPRMYSLGYGKMTNRQSPMSPFIRRSKTLYNASFYLLQYFYYRIAFRTQRIKFFAEWLQGLAGSKKRIIHSNMFHDNTMYNSLTLIQAALNIKKLWERLYYDRNQMYFFIKLYDKFIYTIGYRKLLTRVIYIKRVLIKPNSLSDRVIIAAERKLPKKENLYYKKLKTRKFGGKVKGRFGNKKWHKDYRQAKQPKRKYNATTYISKNKGDEKISEEQKKEQDLFREYENVQYQFKWGGIQLPVKSKELHEKILAAREKKLKKTVKPVPTLHEQLRRRSLHEWLDQMKP